METLSSASVPPSMPASTAIVGSQYADDTDAELVLIRVTRASRSPRALTGARPPAVKGGARPPSDTPQRDLGERRTVSPCWRRSTPAGD